MLSSRTSLPFLIAISAFLLIISIFACRQSSSQERPSVILITLDTLRADFVGAYDSQNASTPHMDFYAERGIVFENAYSPIPITVPAHATLFYSLPPHELGIYNNGQIFQPRQDLQSLPEIFQKNGYRTGAFISLGVLQAKFNLDIGFDVYADQPHPRRWYLTAAEVNERALLWLDRYKDQEFFLWLHYSDPHDPYAPPTLEPDVKIFLNGQPYAELCLQHREDLSLSFPLTKGENRILFEVEKPFPSPRDEYRISLNDFEIELPEASSWKLERGDMLSRGDKQILAFKQTAALVIHSPTAEAEMVIKAKGNINLFPSEHVEGYRKEVEYLDSQLGILTESLRNWGILDKSVIILCGDHGEGLGEYQTDRREAYFGHIHYLQQIYRKIPLIISAPSLLPSPQRHKQLVSLLDIAPTLLALQGWKSPSFFTGRDMLRIRDDENIPLLGETYSPESTHDRFSVLSYPWHLIFTPLTRTFELYNLEFDPKEKLNVYAEHNHEKQIVALSREIVNKADEILADKTEVKLDKESEEMLKSLGYIK